MILVSTCMQCGSSTGTLYTVVDAVTMTLPMLIIVSP
jgi:hypothetical protein